MAERVAPVFTSIYSGFRSTSNRVRTESCYTEHFVCLSRLLICNVLFCETVTHDVSYFLAVAALGIIEATFCVECAFLPHLKHGSVGYEQVVSSITSWLFACLWSR